jgi:polysaccharide biosynthesis transport protein
MSKNLEYLRESGQESSLFPDALPLPQKGSHDNAVFYNRSSSPRDELAKLVKRTFLLGEPCAMRVIVFCGVERGDGAGAICASAGKMLATQVTHRVCVVDADDAGGSLHEHFGVSRGNGLQGALSQSGPIHDYTIDTSFSNLWFMPGGPISPESERVSTDKLRLRLTALRTGFEYVLIHAPAVTSSDVAVLLGQLADGLVLVVRANVTHRETARRAKEILRSSNVTLVGAVMRNRSFPIPESLYRWL